MTPREAQKLMLHGCISFADLHRLSAMTEEAIRKHVTKSRGEIPTQLAQIIRKEFHARSHATADRA